MPKKSRRVVKEKKAAYRARTDERSDPKPKSKLARQLAKLPPPPVPRGRGFQPRPGGTGHDPDGALYVYDTQKAMDFADAPSVAAG